MNKREYFLLCLQAENFLWKRWVLEAFSIFRPGKTHPYPYGLFKDAENRWAFYKPDGTSELIDDANPEQPVFKALGKVELPAGSLKNQPEAVVTSYGTALVNQLLLVWPFGAKIGYMNGEISIGAIEKIIEKRWDDQAPQRRDHLEPETQPIRTSEFLRYQMAAGQLPGFSQLCVPSATAKTMTCDPNMITRRDELLALHKDELHDPVVVAGIMKELIGMDRAWMKDDPGSRFYIKGKAYDVVRAKLYIMQGFSTGFGLEPELITTSLAEGWDIKKLPAMINQLRDGSYGRGAQTALGGVEVKNNNRMYQNSVVYKEDCGSQRGLRMRIDKINQPYLVGHYELIGGQSVLIDEQTVQKKFGEMITVRSPAYCLTGAGTSGTNNYCRCCMGEGIASTPQALGTYAAAIGSLLMDVFMKLMHGKSLTTAEMELDEVFS